MFKILGNKINTDLNSMILSRFIIIQNTKDNKSEMFVCLTVTRWLTFFGDSELSYERRVAASKD